MSQDDILTLAQRLREYSHNPHHINPMSDAFHKLIADSADALSAIASDYATLSAELAALKAASGEEVPARPRHDSDVLESLKRENGYWLGEFAGACDMWDEFNAAHQRITAALRGEVEQLNASLKSLADPETVLVNMLRGTIATPSVRSWSKLFGNVLNEEDARLLEIARLRAELDAIRKQEPVAVVHEQHGLCWYPGMKPAPGAELYAAPPAAAMDGGMVPVKLEVLEASEHWLQIHSCPGSTEWLVADDIGDAISAHRQASQQEGGHEA